MIVQGQDKSWFRSVVTGAPQGTVSTRSGSTEAITRTQKGCCCYCNFYCIKRVGLQNKRNTTFVRAGQDKHNIQQGGKRVENCKGRTDSK